MQLKNYTLKSPSIVNRYYGLIHSTVPEERMLELGVSGGSWHLHKQFELLHHSKEKGPSPSALHITHILKTPTRPISPQQIQLNQQTNPTQNNSSSGTVQRITFRSMPTTRPPVFNGPKLWQATWIQFKSWNPKNKLNKQSSNFTTLTFEKDHTHAQTWSQAPGAQPRSRTEEPGLMSLYCFCIWSSCTCNRNA